MSLTNEINGLIEATGEVPDFDDDDANSGVVNRYNQGKDDGLNHHPDTIDGVCIALAMKWLACKVNGANFRATCISSKHKLNGATIAFVQEQMSLLAKAPGGHSRMKIIEDIAKQAGIAPYMHAPGEPMPWSAGECGKGGRSVVDELWSRRAHAIIGLTPPKGKPGDGHAIGFASGPKSGWVFDPNFGEIRLASKNVAVEVFNALWNKKGYARLSEFYITRYHPSLK